jgi:hypothetical protein
MKSLFFLSVLTNLVAFSAFAETTTPAWVCSIPEDANSLYFVGVGSSSNYKTATESSINNAKNNATEFIYEKLEGIADNKYIRKLVGEAVGVSQEITSHVVMNDNGIYINYSMIRIFKSVAIESAALVAALQGSSTPAGIKVAIREANCVCAFYVKNKLKH